MTNHLNIHPECTPEKLQEFANRMAKLSESMCTLGKDLRGFPAISDRRPASGPAGRVHDVAYLPWADELSQRLQHLGAEVLAFSEALQE